MTKLKIVLRSKIINLQWNFLLRLQRRERQPSDWVRPVKIDFIDHDIIISEEGLVKISIRFLVLGFSISRKPRAECETKLFQTKNIVIKEHQKEDCTVIGIIKLKIYEVDSKIFENKNLKKYRILIKEDTIGPNWI